MYRSYFILVLGIGIIFLCSRCSPKLQSQKPPIETPESFTKTGNSDIINKWWKTFEDERLNRLIDTALNRNFNLKIAWERIKAANSQRRAQASFLLPSIDFGAQTAISRPEPDFAGGENTQLGVSTSYEVDLWGRIKAATDAEKFNLQATYFDYQAASLSLSAELTQVYFQYLITLKQLQLANDQLATNKKIIQLIKVRFGNGQIKGVDILRQKQSLENTRNLKLIYQTNKKVLKNQIAVLVGQPPQNFDLQDTLSLPELPDQPESGLPLELLTRRPDIKASYNRLLSADREMATAIRNKFPRLSLNLSSQARSNNYSELFSNLAYTLGANIVAPLLSWGRLRAEVDRTEAVKNQQLYNYGQSVLTAFQEVENAYIKEENQRKRLSILKKRSTMAKKTYQQLRIEFMNGMTDYIDVLLAFNEQQQLKRDLLTAQQNLLVNRVDLYRSIAGSFSTQREADTELPVSSKNATNE